MIFRIDSSYILSTFYDERSLSLEIINPEIQKYLEALIPQRDQVLGEMEALAKRNNFPIIGPLVGRLLAQLTIATKAKQILELGSGYGYSAYWFSKALDPRGKVICTDGDPKNRERALEFFRRGGVLDKIDFRVGDALSIIDEVEGEFDIILNDIDKESYPDAFHKAVPRLKHGGLLIADNILWSGRVAEKNPDRPTRGILEFNKLIYSSSNLWTTVIPLRDGVSISIKI